MSHLIEVSFKGNRKEFYLWEDEAPPALKAPVIVEADRGEDLGHVLAVGDLALRRANGCSHGPGVEPVTRTVRRVASDDDLQRLSDVRSQDESARRKAMERVRANGLAMKLSDAEWRWDRRKLTLFFTAEKRVDFRNLVRELATMFRTRIELKQIGVRDEAKRLSGIGRCGREYCSASWLPELRPVNLGVAKDQRLSLNPGQISGACGRLMCCLRYEHEFYVRQRKRFPKEGKTVTTGRGIERVLTNDIFRERVTLRGEDGETRVVPLIALRREMGVERTMEMPAEDDWTAPSLEGLSEEVIRLQDTSELPAWVPRPAAPPPARTLPVVESTDSVAPAEGVEREQGVRSFADSGAVESQDSSQGTRTGGPTTRDTLEHGDATPREPEPDADAPTAGSESGPPSPEQRQGRRRRRRGRRGGRRGRGGSPGGPSEPSPPGAA